MTATSATGKCGGSRLSQRRVCGFTLIELLVALTIMVLIAGALPIALGRMLPGRRVTVAADRLVVDLRWLQGESIRVQAPGQLTLLPDGYRMQVGHRNQDVALADTTHIQLRSRVDERELRQLQFFPDGTAVAALIWVADSGRNAELEVSMLTGRVNRIR